ncbi:hypothetical protein GCM10010435_60210 [Winogradskya consettensis]|uniref:DUF3558 domain-containing protein n=1 Tax=Winogradskya consettensis TaxID=113560 RepID=A0A919SR75_9ACTN|nr:hypothetical protein [Actinoplanes consettensis]GIM76424.1 hypothetical protein Aco04nite_50350 [Actinoplanes consettensis]
MTGRVLVAGLALVLSGCGSPAPEDPPHASEWDINAMATPCRLVTQDEVSQVTGRTAAAGVRLATWPPLCQFVLQPGGTLVYVGDNPQATGRQEFDQLRNSGQATEPVTGLGDRAYWVPELTTLHVMIGTAHLKVVFAGPGVPAAGAARSAAEKLAAPAISRLGQQGA